MASADHRYIIVNVKTRLRSPCDAFLINEIWKVEEAPIRCTCHYSGHYSRKKTQRIARVFEFINIYKIYITKSLSKMYSKHTSLYAAYFAQTSFPQKKHISSKNTYLFVTFTSIVWRHGIRQAADRPKEAGVQENKKASPWAKAARTSMDKHNSWPSASRHGNTKRRGWIFTKGRRGCG